jgi:hypothetical protein
MKAIRLHGRGGPDRLVYEDAPQPHPGLGEVLVRVYATGVIANELKWDETYQTSAGSPRALPIPGRDLSEWSRRSVRVLRHSPRAPRSIVLATWYICSGKAIVKAIERTFTRCRSMCNQGKM